MSESRSSLGLVSSSNRERQEESGSNGATEADMDSLDGDSDGDFQPSPKKAKRSAGKRTLKTSCSSVKTDSTPTNDNAAVESTQLLPGARACVPGLHGGGRGATKDDIKISQSAGKACPSRCALAVGGSGIIPNTTGNKVGTSPVIRVGTAPVIKVGTAPMIRVGLSRRAPVKQLHKQRVS